MIVKRNVATVYSHAVFVVSFERITNQYVSVKIAEFLNLKVSPIYLSSCFCEKGCFQRNTKTKKMLWLSKAKMNILIILETIQNRVRYNARLLMNKTIS